MTIALALGARIAGTRFQHLPEAAVHWAKVGILDTVGCILAGAHEPCALIIGRQATIGTTGGQCLVFGHDRRVGPLEAALINGTAAHALDYDDCSDTLGGHLSAPVVPALFALAETRPTSGRDFITAYVAGWEAETRIARGVNFHHYEKGWHPTATLGVFGAAAACARLLGLDAGQTARALALAATFSSGIKANFGTMTKPLHVGHAARNGLLSALLAADDFTAREDALEHPQGFLELFNGAGRYETARILEGWGDPWDIVDPGLAIKQYPCCGSTHPAIDAMLMLVREHDLKPGQVTRIAAQTHKRRLAHTNRPDPRGALDAKFSVQYCLVRALVSGRIGIEHFEGDSFREPEIRALLPHVTATAQAAVDIDPSSHFGADLQVTLADGRVLTQSVPRPLGRGPEVPLPEALLHIKFRNCAERALSPTATEALLGQLRGVENANELGGLTAAMISSANRAATRVG
jgi:2-methylcitrate dehydratase PrpD